MDLVKKFYSKERVAFDKEAAPNVMEVKLGGEE